MKELASNREISLNAPGGPADELEQARKKIFDLERELARKTQEHEHLQQVYNKLADQWNVFQSTNRPDNRNIQRAEGAGEMARKLGEIFLSLAYDTDARDLIIKLLETMRDAQSGAAGQEVEAYPSGRLPTAKRLPK